MKQLAWPSNAAEGLAGQVGADVRIVKVSPSKWVTDPAFEAGIPAASPMAKMSGLGGGLQGPGVHGNEAEFVAEARRAVDVVGSAVHRDHDGQVERQLAVVVGHKPGRPVPACTVPVLNSVTSSMSRLASSPDSSRLQTGLVNAPSRGVA